MKSKDTIALIIGGVFVVIAIAGVVIIALFDEPSQNHTEIIYALLALISVIGTAVAALIKVGDNTKAVERMNHTIQNGGLEAPVTNVVNGEEFKKSVKCAVGEVMAETSSH